MVGAVIGIVWDGCKMTGGWLSGLCRSPLKLEIEYFAYEDVRDDVVVRSCENQERYRVDVSMTNRAQFDVYLKSARLLINKDIRPQFAEHLKGVNLKSGEMKEHSLIFTLDGIEPVSVGDYVLYVVPTVGRTAKTKGHFPVK
ncbi:hypothetical protein STSP2_01386 [Anaerohalosphaera lusitana]|uniref:Uncharacterized protein n=1 Tax=Anaerohalosphaera lusitana TaxID=1936003 RepID=A0A1U9NKW4_9BACT|nr:hypothetical protein [Anaerohalosphaera lusitana]AQT68230.1 hypothetical protein STSP2_01386 [Anaerohalosphaera lusitana]